MSMVLAIAGIAGCGSGGAGGSNGGMDIWKAVENEDVAYIEAYASQGKNLEVGKTLRGTTPLLYALKLKKRKSYETLLDVGAGLHTQCRGGDVPLHMAAREHDPYWLTLALEHGGDPNWMNQSEGLRQGTPMYYAISGDEQENVENVKLLLDHGADIDATINRRGDTALAHACKTREFETVYLLLERGADYNTPGREENSFIFAIRNRRLEHFETLNAPHEEKWCKAVWEWLIAHGADPDKAEWDGEKWVWK